MTDEAYRPKVGDEAWITERRYGETRALYKGTISKVTATLQVVVDYAYQGRTLQLRFKPSRFHSKDWDCMGQSTYSNTYYVLYTGPGLSDAVRLKLRRENAITRGGYRLNAAHKDVKDLVFRWDDKPEKMAEHRAVIQKLLDAIDANVELLTMPEPPAEPENDQ